VTEQILEKIGVQEELYCPEVHFDTACTCRKSARPTGQDQQTNGVGRPVGVGGRQQPGAIVDQIPNRNGLQEELFCDEFHLVDLRVYDNCKKIVKGCEHVFNLAADMGGMGFIQSNHSVIMYNNTMISFNMVEVARIEGVKRCIPPPSPPISA